MKGIADTGFVIAFLNRSDLHHQWAVEIARGVSEPLLTCEAVLAESAFQVGSTERVLALVKDGLLEIAFDLSKNLEAIRELAERYQNRMPDLADLCLVRMSELFTLHSVITVHEADFRVYRRNKREVIPLVAPPRS